ncbi:MAG: hypothetical protein LC097_09730 [Burkholderiales bacterium]|nr:hypothetical protein [Burkholderiales bacterium]
MLDGLRKALGLGPHPAAVPPGVVTPAQLAHWAAARGWRYAAADGEGGYTLEGRLGEHAWQLESGTPTRDYMQGAELRLRAELPIDPGASVMLMNRALKEELEVRAYGAITQDVQTTVTESLPQELRWLSILEEVSVPHWPASFRQAFAVLGSRARDARQCVHAAVVAQAMHEGQAAAPGQVPLVLMLDEGSLLLRMQTLPSHLPDLEYALALFLMVAQVAMHHLPPPAPEAAAPAAPPPA